MLHVCYLYKQTIGVIMKGKGRGKKQQVRVLTRIQTLVRQKATVVICGLSD